MGKIVKSGLAIVVYTLLAHAAGPVGLEKIAAYAGTWKIQTEHFKTRFSEAGKESSTLRNDCWRSGGFFVCDQFVDGESRDLIVYTYNAKDDTYNSYSVPAEGGRGGSGTLLIRDNVWTFPWERTQDGKTYHFRVVNVFLAPGTIEYRQEFSEDQVHWTITGKGLEHRVEAPR
ncbi:MAG TPA: hypothetical protein VMI94_20705 [Bryobacteraceae bacterium]|nr:hypothetical protein [Bryobacteraceae bacterium]